MLHGSRNWWKTKYSSKRILSWAASNWEERRKLWLFLSSFGWFPLLLTVLSSSVTYVPLQQVIKASTNICPTPHGSCWMPCSPLAGCFSFIDWVQQMYMPCDWKWLSVNGAADLLIRSPLSTAESLDPRTVLPCGLSKSVWMQFPVNDVCELLQESKLGLGSFVSNYDLHQLSCFALFMY